MFEDFTGCWIVTSSDGKFFKPVVVFRRLLSIPSGGFGICISESFTGSD